VIEVFEFGGQKVRTAGTHEAPLFCAADVCPVLGYDRTDTALRRLDQDEMVLEFGDSGKSTKRTVFVTESGLFNLILGSKKPEAKAFRKWVTSEVLPAIRRKGYYSAIEAEQEKLTERLLAECFPNLPGKAEPIFRGLIAALLKLRREGAIGNPAWGPSLARMIYGWAIPIEGEQPLRRKLNSSPNGSSVDYSMLSERARESVLQIINTATAFASPGVSADYADWKRKMELAFGKKAIQLPFLVSMAQLPPREGAAE
jgi:hypothetical protein